MPVISYHNNVKRAILSFFALAFAIACAREFAIAQTDQGQRRKAFQASKQLADLGDFADAVDILEPLADAGDEMALYTIGVLYATGGKDLPKDLAKALAFYQKAADKRHAGSMRQLAIAYQNGLGVPANPTIAGQWYDSAANRGDALAQLSVGLMFANGQGRPKSSTQAYKWLTLASTGVFFDDEAARRTETKTALKTLVAQMTPADVNAGEKLVREFSAQ